VFTGIVQEIGNVVSSEDGRLVVRTTVSAAVGDSVSVDGACLTVVDGEGGHLAFDVVPETLQRTKPFSGEVNLEPALRAGDPLGGHYVQGHVDGVGRVRSAEAEGDGMRVVVEAPPEILRYCVEKGSVTVDGVSLTVAELTNDAFGAALVPHTLEVTTLSRLAAGALVNLEVDVLAKYVERLLRPVERDRDRATIPE
jgi:riboflavin synthase